MPICRIPAFRKARATSTGAITRLPPPWSGRWSGRREPGTPRWLRELSIRVALGAQAKQILSAALGRMLILLASGSVVGILLGVAASRVLSAIVFQASAQDPFVLVAVAFTTVLAGLLSVVNPVRRALHIDPANLLREQ